MQELKNILKESSKGDEDIQVLEDFMFIFIFCFSNLIIKTCLKCPCSKKNCCLFERLSKEKKKNFLFWNVFFVLEVSMFLYCANEESDDVIDGSAFKTVQYSIKNISRNIKGAVLKLGTWRMPSLLGVELF